MEEQMRSGLLHLTLVVFAGLASAALAAPGPTLSPPSRLVSSCTVDVAERERLLTLSVSRFDRSGEGWRTYGEAHCYSQAAGLIADYVDGHGAALSPDDESILRFHAAQMLANANREDDALSELARVLALDERRKAPDPGWRWYIQGTMAFLRQDRPSLDASAQGLDSYAKGEGGAVQAGDRLNLNALHGLQRCLGRGYALAYSAPDCRDLDEARRLNDAIG